VFYASRKATDPAGQLSDPILVTNNPGNAFNYNFYYSTNYYFRGQRWGDLSSLAPDPSNDLIIWGTSEWAALENAWGIQATQYIPAAI
jgi:hypothetical protein